MQQYHSQQHQKQSGKGASKKLPTLNSKGHIVICSLLALSTLGFIATCLLIVKPLFTGGPSGPVEGRKRTSASNSIYRSWKAPLSYRYRRSIMDFDIDQKSVVGLAHSLVKNRPKISYQVVVDQKELPYKSLRLPDNLIPLKYHLDFDVDVNKDNFTGVVRMVFLCESPTNRVIFHARNISPTNITVYSSGRSVVQQNKVVYMKESQMFVIELNSNLEEDSTYDVVIEYNAVYSLKLAGLYKSMYTDQGAKKTMLSTHFEPTDARSAFPCLDEPFFKAIFHISISHAKNMTAMSNMPVERTEEINGGNSTTNITVFAPTLKMSTYLIALSVNDYTYKENITTKGVKVRVYGRKEDEERIQYATSAATKIINFYETLLKTSYPISKCDLLAVPDFQAGAMEDWGLISFRSSLLVFDPNFSTVEYKKTGVLVIAHELAHQWFGNLVTMKWWNDIWLNEGFASFFELLAANDVNEQFMALELQKVQGWQAAISMDSMKHSHQLAQPNNVTTNFEVSEVFDTITYSKGASILHMMHGFMGDKFVEGLKIYLDKHQYGNAETDDLWNSLSKVSDGLDIKEIMDTWVCQQNFPIVTIEKINELTFKLTQESFLVAKQRFQNNYKQNQNVSSRQNSTTDDNLIKQRSNSTIHAGNSTLTKNTSISSTDNLMTLLNSTVAVGNSTSNNNNNNNTYISAGGNNLKTPAVPRSGEEELKNVNQDKADPLWHIPLTYITDQNGTENLVWFKTKEMTLNLSTNVKWLKANVGMKGFYVVNYDSGIWSELLKQLKYDKQAIPSIDRASLIHDSFKLACDRLTDPFTALNLSRYLKYEMDYLPMTMFRSKYDCLSVLMKEKTSKQLYQKYIWKLQSHLIVPEMLDDKRSSSKTVETKMQRLETIFLALKHNFSKELKEKAVNMFNNMYSNKSLEGVSPENRLLALNHGFDVNNTDHYTFLWQLYETSPLDTDRRILMKSFAQFRSKINETLSRALNTTLVRIQDTGSMLAQISRAGYRKEVWDYMMKRYDVFTERYGAGHDISKLLIDIAGGFNTKEMQDKVKRFIDDHPVGGKNNSLTEQMTLEKIHENIMSGYYTSSETSQQQIKIWLDDEMKDSNNSKHSAIVKLVG